jgi:hypothetical protein
MLAQTRKILPGLDAPIIMARGGKRGLSHRSENAHVQYWTGPDIPIEINDQRLSTAYQVWMNLAHDTTPRLRAFMTSQAATSMDDSTLFLAVNGDYLVVSQGEGSIRKVGRDLRGRLQSEFKVPIVPIMCELYDRCIEERLPIYIRYVSDLASSSIYWEGLFVPLKGDDQGHANFVMKIATPLDSKSDILQMILDRSPVGLITAVPIGEVLNVGQIIDGRIIFSINARAKELLKFDEKGSQVHYIRDLALWLRDGAGWTRTDIKVDGKTTHIRYRDTDNRTYTVTMEAVRRYVLFSIMEDATGVLPRPAD